MRCAPLLLLILAAAVLACGRRAPVEPPAPAAAERPPPAPLAVRPLSGSSGAGVAVIDAAGRRFALVADTDAHAIDVVDLDARAVLVTHDLGASPGQILVSPGGTVFVSRRDAGDVVALELREGPVLGEVARADTGAEPYGLALGERDATLLVTTIAGATLEAFRAQGLVPIFTVPVASDPRSVIVTADERAFVSHATGSTLSAIDLAARTAVRIGLDATERRRDFGMARITKPPSPSMVKVKALPARVRFTMKRTASQGFALARIGGEVLLPETLVLTSDGSQIPTGYGAIEQSTLGTHVPFVARVGADTGEVERTSFSGPEDRACFEGTPRCLLPRAAASDGERLFVACMDSDAVEVVDPKADAEHAPACKKTLAERVRIQVEKPEAVAVDGAHGEVVAVSMIARSIVVAKTDGGGAPVRVALPPVAAEALAAEGRRLFHTSADRRIARDGRACASCHVEGRDDGLVWPTPKGKRQTPMLAGRIAETAPYGWNGEHATLPMHVESTVKNLSGAGLSPEAVRALARYVETMKAPPRARAGADAARGRAVFASAETGCAACHDPAARFTDGETHALGRERTAFATPSLAFVGRSAPYFHDGRYATLEALVDGCDGEMGATAHLSSADKSALVAYLRTL